ncbi:MAG: class I SAM-dependent methyltransferase [Kofleriaceae bacterium]|nr:class I SAM-dependent methyltransferase [Kofleriaceae bacterium]
MIALGSTSFRLWLRLRHRAGAPRGEPTDRREQAVLASRAEWRVARDQARRLGLPLHPDPPKSWDTLLALGAILRRVPRTGRVLDAGAERYSALLPSLYLYGYDDLHGLNLAFTRPVRRGPIRYLPGDVMNTGLPAASFGAITCLSVIEHGVRVDDFLAEAARLLRPGGVLVVSTDYWPDPVDTRGQYAYGVPIQIFTRADLTAAVAAAARHGLVPSAPIDDALAVVPAEAPVRWDRVALDYTFAVLTFVRH